MPKITKLFSVDLCVDKPTQPQKETPTITVRRFRRGKEEVFTRKAVNTRKQWAKGLRNGLAKLKAEKEAREGKNEWKEELYRLLSDKKWRMNNLYFIVSKQGDKVLFKLNLFQEELLDHLWYLNIVLKARQLGMTTFIDLFLLDEVLFNKNKHAAIIAHTLEDAQVIFRDKIQFPWENLPAWLKQMYQADSENIRELRFSNGSSIRVATSVRSGTLQYLHISEFGRICQKYPEKADEIVTGSLNAVHPEQIIFIESTAKGREGHFYEMSKKAMADAVQVKKGTIKLTPLDYRFFFFPWWKDTSYVLHSDTPLPTYVVDYGKKLAGEGINLSHDQLVWWWKKHETQKDEMYSEYPSTPDEAFKASVEGSYYGKLVDKAYEVGRITRVPHEPTLKVSTWWDLGVGDATAIIFTQQVGSEIRIIDYYENSGEGLPHYAKVLQEKGYIYDTHNAPHDIQVKELGSGKSRKEIALKLGISFRAVKNLSIEDGIEAGRAVFSKCWFDLEHTEKLLKALGAYRKEWDDRLGEWKGRPFHNWASHAADAWRYMGIGINDIVEYKEDKEETQYFDTHGLFNEIF